MKQLAEKLFDKHLTKIIGDITMKICKEKFDAVFKEVCESGSLNNTTIGLTYEVLQALAIKEINELFYLQTDEVDQEVWKLKFEKHSNPFYEMLYVLWQEFTEYTWVTELVESFIGDEFHEKQQDLYEKGILDFNGDYTGV